MKKKLITVIVNKWLKVRRAPKNEQEIPDYEGGDYDVEMNVYGQIGEDWTGDKGVMADDFAKSLKDAADKKVLVRLHGPGGNVWDAFAIHNAIREHGNADTRIDGLAASAHSVIFQAGKNRIMPTLAMQMVHKTSTLAIGNAEELEDVIDQLKAHDKMLADMYSARSGLSVSDCMDIMDKESWMDGRECMDKGLCDTLVNDEPVTNKFTRNAFKRFQHVPEAILNALAPGNRGVNPPKKDIVMNREEMIALLKGAGVEVANDATDKWLKDELGKLKKPTPAPAPPPPNNVIDLATLPESVRNSITAMDAQLQAQKKITVTAKVDKLITDMKVPANQREDIITRAVKDETILDMLDKLQPAVPGFQPVSNIEVTSTSLDDIINGYNRNRAPITACLQGRVGNPRDKQVRNDIGEGSKATAKMLRLKIENETKGIGKNEIANDHRMQIISDLCDKIGMSVRNDTQQGPYGSVTVSSDLQRQVIMSESMRAFRRRLVPLEVFSHTFNNVPLQGNDYIEVPYYPLFTTVSQRFVSPTAGQGVAPSAGYGYQFGSGTDQAMRKNILVGGVGSSAKTAGVDRAYQPMTWSAYLLRRQPWVDIQKLAVMRVEQLAFDILNDIINAWVLKANFGVSPLPAILPTSFDDTTVATLAGVARKSDWPEGMRYLVLGTDYWVNLASSPYVKAFLNIGTTDIIREGKIGGLYGFADTVENPRIPQTTDGNLVAWISYPSALLVATSPIMPAPGELRVMVSYDVITDDQIGLSFEYKYWGEPWNSVDREIVECNYGSGLGELAALKRIVNQGT